jgi:nitroreductase
MILRDLIRSNRSYRRFDQHHEIDRSILVELIDLARCSPSAANLQPLKYFISWKPDRNDLIFPHLTWAGYLRNWPGPQQGERPTAYIIILADTAIKKDINCDHGIVSQSMLLGACERGLGGCIIASINRPALMAALKLPDRYSILLVLALGKPAEKVVLEPLSQDGKIEYWRDPQGIHHVPKRSLEDLILE